MRDRVDSSLPPMSCSPRFWRPRWTAGYENVEIAARMKSERARIGRDRSDDA